MPKRGDYIPVECIVLKRTDSAVLLGTDNGEVWIPLSLCEGADEIDEGDEEVCVERWKAEQEGID